MIEDLFGSKKELSRSDKMRLSRKATNELTSDAINYLNKTNQFMVHRQNNIPSTRLSKKEIIHNVFDKEGNPVIIKYEEITVSFKSNQKQFALLDIAGFTKHGIHIELEVKTGNDKLKSDQADRIKSIKDTGGISFVFDSMKTLKVQIKPFLEERKPAF